MQQDYINKIQLYLKQLCYEFGNRAVGSKGNRRATDLFREVTQSFGFQAISKEFDCLDWEDGEVSIKSGNDSFEAFASPYGKGIECEGKLVEASSLDILSTLDCTDKVLLLHGEITKEPLMPKNFVFYNPEEHQRIIALLEAKQPKAIIAASGRCPELSGAVYPFPFIEDGDFDIPSVYMTEEEGSALIKKAGQEIRIISRARRFPAKGVYVRACKGLESSPRIVVSAHIDAKKTTPGALDNAGGVAVLMLLAEMLNTYNGKNRIELIPFNGEDYYGANSQMIFLQDNKGNFQSIMLNINLDGAGLIGERTGLALFKQPENIQNSVKEIFHDDMLYAEIPPWYQGDHMVFAMQGIPAMAISTEYIGKIMVDITHTAKDIPELIDPQILVAIAQRIYDLILALS